jgi:pimeloyl-ACP methyl ester carboxylesterase
MVLIEPGADDPRRLLQDGKVVHASDLASGRSIPAVKVATPLRVSDIPSAALDRMMAAAKESARNANPGPRDKLPADAKRMRTWALGQVGHVAAAVNPFEAEELADMAAERKKSVYPLGDMPLLVLTRGIAEEEGPDGKALEAEHRRDHQAIADTSRSGKLVIAPHSGHHVQLDEPELVIQSIHEVLTAAANSKQP